MLPKLALALCLIIFSFSAAAEPRTIGVFVALADNQHQGIVPVPKALGNGNDPEQNLYWGSADGLATVFSKSAAWQLLDKQDLAQATILRTRHYQHKATGAQLYAFAYQGSAIQQAIADFEQALVQDKYDLVVFIGHNGLMDFKLALNPSSPTLNQSPDSIVLACKSEKYFKERIQQLGGRPTLLTTQFMYPGAFILHAALNEWLAGHDLK